MSALLVLGGLLSALFSSVFAELVRLYGGAKEGVLPRLRAESDPARRLIIDSFFGQALDGSARIEDLCEQVHISPSSLNRVIRELYGTSFKQKLIEARAVDVMVAVGPNMFYTVTLPCTLWFFDKGKAKTKRADTVLFIDARHIYRQVDRAHRDWTPAQIGLIANLVRLYRGEALDAPQGGKDADAKLKEVFGKKPVYADIPGLCKAATLTEIEAQGWSLNPGRYVGVAPGEDVSDEDFKEQLETLNEELESLNAQARELEQTIAANVAGILEA